MGEDTISKEREEEEENGAVQYSLDCILQGQLFIERERDWFGHCCGGRGYDKQGERGGGRKWCCPIFSGLYSSGAAFHREGERLVWPWQNGE